jgi:hypothetical protein
MTKKSVLLIFFLCFTTANIFSSGFEGFYFKKYKSSGNPNWESSVTVKIIKKGKKIFINFEIKKALPDRILQASAECVLNKKKELEFVFIDGWENKGTGKFYLKKNKYFLHLNMAKQSITGYAVSMLYDIWEVEKKK